MPGKNLKWLVPVLPLVTPLVAAWIRNQQASILARGEALTPPQIEDARRAGVLHPEKIRLRFVETIPMPGPRLLRALARRTGLLGRHTSGVTLFYGIYIRNKYWGDRHLYLHEFVHVAQYERLGSIQGFLRPYLRECLDPGYPAGPLEQEAIQTAHQILQKE